MIVRILVAALILVTSAEAKTVRIFTNKSGGGGGGNFLLTNTGSALLVNTGSKFKVQ